jgi:protein-S-isoprenylcysteine O-methyltransferase Ste14
MLFWIAGIIATREFLLLITLVVMSVFYLAAIRREEQELLARLDLPGYAESRQRTGCVVPRLRLRVGPGRRVLPRS